MSETAGVYAACKGYEIAFSYRDVPSEVDALLAWASATCGTGPASVVELAAGPADHALEFARRGLRSTALDLSEAMCQRARVRAMEQDLAVTVIQADMRNFTLTGPVDLAVTMLDSTTHLLTAEDLAAHLLAVARNVRPGGCYIIEMSHPSDAEQPTTATEWEVVKGTERVRIQWGTLTDEHDTTTGITDVRVNLEYTDGLNTMTVWETIPCKKWSEAELDAAIAAAGGWRVEGRYGSFDGVELSAPTAWRMITVLLHR